MNILATRWVELPDGVREVAPGLPAGFRAAGVACGLKADGGLDVGLLVSDAATTTSAARFTRSGVLAAPVVLCQEGSDLNALRAVVANSGNANAATGPRGLDDAALTQAAAAEAAGVNQRAVAVASTGVIGVSLNMDALVPGVAAAGAALAPDGDADFSDAIRTTDAFPKRATLEIELSGGTVRLSGQAKGAGMISPNHATMLCFVQTDAALSAETAELLLGVTVKRSFDRITVDGQLSTNDTVILMASGDSGVGVEPETEDELRFGLALDALMRALALAVVRDGEGARRIGRVIVRGGHEGNVEAVARAIGNSPLVKTALHGGDPNWGRVAQAIGAALPGTGPLPFDIAIEGIRVCSAGAALPFDAGALAEAVAGDSVEYEVELPGAGVEVELFFSDLSHEYVTINAEYTT